MFTYSTLRDLRHGYFRIEIERIDAGVLPVLPKDIVFVQDCSASMTEQRIYFCRQGLAAALETIGERDRFNLVRFKDQAEFCFADWSANTDAARKKALQFIDGMRAGGETDILTSIKTLQKLDVSPGRPAVAVLITVGRSTTGTTEASGIIREFSRLNEGQLSVFTLGTIQTANTYLLDILSYCNRGETRIVSSGRWGIPEYMQSLTREVRRPVLSDVNFRFPEAAETEVFPVLTMNLFSDRPLVLYGRYRKGTDRVIFQAAGTAGGKRCDMVFDMPIGDAQESRDKTLRSEWGRQKVYHLVGEYARTGDPSLLRQIDETARAYRVPVPHRGEF
jgi:Ca-activated chloride channel family protein